MFRCTVTPVTRCPIWSIRGKSEWSITTIIPPERSRSPGTSTILTGLHPWSHRVFQLGAELPPAHAGHTIFSALSSTHSTLGFTQNKFADQLLYQDESNLDDHVHNWSFNTQNTNLYNVPIFKKDARIAFAGFEDNILQRRLMTYSSSLFFDPLFTSFSSCITA